ncbi:Required for formation of the rod structure in the basal body of the flagellar apparatus. Together with FliI and FliH [Vibrio sp. B1FLJ16]|uniref:flagellar biosynthesis protein FlhB n=1 Tax=Vibrio sp. B1FLJ16 TaxID=2751178 RepID=UPI0015F700A6|nr:flagellar biosynthesis protein FlhB [Vibrio sp. B1FLJ16]CAD7811269.1 Required for formation of the rod structure in the basal body of the flagellar apparatus. Together with FliI and FliH [Vibrio sp. B1FLJ16]CAE6914556.1 Required for formation of the rod structure in the basal body of the flagellar apparatus. Together with FliI and FliH [Vibrio sp. B1FLJ16]
MSDDKTEAATGQRLQKARKEGQLPRAKEFTTAMTLAVTVLYFVIYGDTMWQTISNTFAMSFQFDVESVSNTQHLLKLFSKAVFFIVQLFLPLFLFKLISVIGGSVALGGWVMNLSLLMPKFDKISPLKGIKRIFSMNSIVEFLKNVLKVAIFFYLLYFAISENLHVITNLSRTSFNTAFLTVGTFIQDHVYTMIGVIILFGLIDFPYQKYTFNKQMKMSKQEVKEEHKQNEGKPEIKARIRQLQQQRARGTAAQAVPGADVVLMNPTHYAVALKYDLERAEAPFVVAKGIEEVAYYIRELAESNDVEVLVIPDLTRSIYHTTQIGQMIPNQLFVAVAQILNYVNQLRRWKAGTHLKPQSLPSFTIPEDLKY